MSTKRKEPSERTREKNRQREKVRRTAEPPEVSLACRQADAQRHAAVIMAESPDEALHATRLTPKDMLRPLWQNHPTVSRQVGVCNDYKQVSRPVLRTRRNLFISASLFSWTALCRLLKIW